MLPLTGVPNVVESVPSCARRPWALATLAAAAASPNGLLLSASEPRRAYSDIRRPWTEEVMLDEEAWPRVRVHAPPEDHGDEPVQLVVQSASVRRLMRCGSRLRLTWEVRREQGDHKRSAETR